MGISCQDFVGLSREPVTRGPFCAQHEAEETEALRGVTQGVTEQQVLKLGCHLRLQEAPWGCSSPVPTLYPVDTKTETGFMAPGPHTCFLITATGLLPLGKGLLEGPEAQTGPVTQQGQALGVPLLSLGATVPKILVAGPLNTPGLWAESLPHPLGFQTPFPTLDNPLMLRPPHRLQ